MRLSDLNPTFIKITDVALNLQENTDNIEEAGGLVFDCPSCHKDRIIIWQPKLMWKFRGFGYGDLTIEPVKDIEIKSSCGYSFSIIDGKITDYAI